MRVILKCLFTIIIDHLNHQHMHQLRRNCVLLILTGSYIVIHTYHAVTSTVPHDNYSIYIYRSKFTEGMKVKMQFFLLKNPNLMTGLRVLRNIMISIQGSMLSTSAVTMRPFC